MPEVRAWAAEAAMRPSQPGPAADWRPLRDNREGFPLWGEVHAGNASDKKLNNELIAKIRDAFSQEQLRTLIHVADSAFVTIPNLAQGGVDSMTPGWVSDVTAHRWVVR